MAAHRRPCRTSLSFVATTYRHRHRPLLPPTSPLRSVPPSRPPGMPIAAPYVAAGFFAAPSDFLRDLPFDPFLPWVFMGEEIMLSSRFFTNGYDIFAPRENILAHEYRPGSMGLPKVRREGRGGRRIPRLATR